MKKFVCGNVVAGCDKEFRGLDNTGIVERATEHAVADHGVAGDQAFAAQVRDAITPL